MNDAVLSNLREPADAHVRADDRSRANSSALPDDYERADARVSGNHRPFFYSGERMHTGWRVPWIRKKLNGAGERQIRVACAQYGEVSAVSCIASNDSGGACLFELDDVLGIREERELPGLSVLERCHAGNLDCTVPFQTALETVGNLLQLHVDTALRWKKLSRCSSRRVAATACTLDSRTTGSRVRSFRNSANGALG